MMVVPLIDDGRVILEHVYRYTIQETVLECPSGGLDGDTPERGARRELEEETGWVAGRLAPLGSFYGSNGISDVPTMPSGPAMTRGRVRWALNCRCNSRLASPPM